MSDKTLYRIFASLFLIVLFGAISYWSFVVHPRMKHAAACDRIRERIESLADRQPQDLTEKQWLLIIHWTINANGNCLVFHFDLPQKEMEQFEAEFDRRLEGDVSLETIDWIWDEYVRLTRVGQTYSDKFRPTSSVKLKEFEEYPYDDYWKP